MCVTITPLVFFVILFLKSFTHIFQFFGSLSTNTGFKLFLTTAIAAEIILNVGIIISLFDFKFNVLIAISKAAVPLETETANFLFNSFEIFLSIFNISTPDYDTHPFLTTLYTACASAKVIFGLLTGIIFIKCLYFYLIIFLSLFAEYGPCLISIRLIFFKTLKLCPP